MSSDRARYRPAHGDLLTRVAVNTDESRPALTLGGVLVPTSRNLRRLLPGLKLAAEVARRHGCPLVVITSQEAQARQLPAALMETLGPDLLIIDLPKVSPFWHPSLRTRQHSLQRLHRAANDVGMKRNLGISIARAAGVQTLLYLDDDVIADAGELRLDEALAAMAADDRVRTVGWTLESFPDNSVAGHVRRLVPGHDQSVFMGGGAMLVRVTEGVPFFPDIYNEDWLFLQAMARDSAEFNRAVLLGGELEQLIYNPFLDYRARAEEAGEVLAEGLMNLIEDGCFDEWRSVEYWRECLAARQSMLRRLRRDLLSAPRLDHGEHYVPVQLRERARRALASAIKVNEALRPTDFVNYLHVWQEDSHSSWPDHLARMSKGLDDLPADDWLVRSLVACRRQRSKTPATPAPAALAAESEIASVREAAGSEETVVTSTAASEIIMAARRMVEQAAAEPTADVCPRPQRDTAGVPG